MAEKMAKSLVLELDKLMEVLAGGDADARHVAMTKLESYERGGKIPVSALLEMAEESNPSMVMYAISALGRNKSPQGVRKLIALAKKHETGHRILLETVVDALGEAGDKSAGPVLLGLVGLKLRFAARMWDWLPWRRRKEPTEAELRQRGAMALPVVRAVEKLNDPAAATALADYLDHDDPLVRWHAIRALANAKVTDFTDKLRQMGAEDGEEVVREAALIALNDLEALPRHLNN